MLSIELDLLLIGVAVIISVAGHMLFEYTGLPESVFMIALGLISGPILGVISPDVLNLLIPYIFTLSIIVILFESGLETQIGKVFNSMKVASFFTLIVLIVTTAIGGAFMHFVVGWNLYESLLVGVICSGTSTMPVIYFTSKMEMDKDVKQILIFESIFNDVTLLTAVTLIIQMITLDLNFGFAFGSLIRHLFLAGLLGVFSGLAWSYILIKFFQDIRLKYISSIAAALILYTLTELESASGIMAVLVFSLIIGNINDLVKNSKYFNEQIVIWFTPIEKELKAIQGIQGEMSFLAKNFFFFIMGILFDLSALNVFVLKVTFTLICLMVFSRLVSVGVLSIIDKKYLRDIVAIALMLPRGITASLAAFLPIEEGIVIPWLKEIVVVMVLVTTITATVGYIFVEKDANKSKL